MERAQLREPLVQDVARDASFGIMRASGKHRAGFSKHEVAETLAREEEPVETIIRRSVGRSAAVKATRKLGGQGMNKPCKTGDKPSRQVRLGVGAGEGNRTLVCSLGSCRSAIELRPQINDLADHSGGKTAPPALRWQELIPIVPGRSSLRSHATLPDNEARDSIFAAPAVPKRGPASRWRLLYMRFSVPQRFSVVG
jgi:hypothetical protein